MAPETANHHHHAVLFPFMSKGHTIPVLHLARLLVGRSVDVTLFTTPANRPFISNYLTSKLDVNNVSIVSLPFPEGIGNGVPPGIESTDKLPEISLWVHVAKATELMKPHFERALEALPSRAVTFMVSDAFLSWTLDSAQKFGIPRLYYFGMSIFAGAMSSAVGGSGLLQKVDSDDEPFPVPDFPWIKLTRNDFDPPLTTREPGGLLFDFVMGSVISCSQSYGQIVNSFHDLERQFVDYNVRTKGWSVGPLCLAEAGGEKDPGGRKTPWIEWLDERANEGKPVLYVAFGSQAEISPEQFEEIKTGLEKSGVSFLWVVRKNEAELRDGFEGRVKGRGLIVKEWVDQREILSHRSVHGFLSHCGWNSVLESICAKVPILAWPMMAEQPLNARFVAEEIKAGIRVETRDGAVRGLVTAAGLERSVRELMEGEMGKKARERVAEYGGAAFRAVEEGGSSWKALNELLDELHLHKNKFIWEN